MAIDGALAGTAWRPVDIAGAAVPATTPLMVRFDIDGGLSGHGGCNAFTGFYALDRVNLTIGPLAMTRMACPPGIMRREAAFVAALDATRLFLRDGARLTFKDARGASLLRLVQIDPA